MTAAHNHPPRCCCGVDNQTEPPTVLTCQVCPEHGSLATSLPATEALCGFRNLGDMGQICEYPPHSVDTPHSWQGSRHAINPNPGGGS